MVNKEYWRNHWFFKKYEVTKDMSLIEQIWRIQWNHKAFIFIECGVVYLVCSWIKYGKLF